MPTTALSGATYSTLISLFDTLVSPQTLPQVHSQSQNTREALPTESINKILARLAAYRALHCTSFSCLQNSKSALSLDEVEVSESVVRQVHTDFIYSSLEASVQPYPFQYPPDRGKRLFDLDAAETEIRRVTSQASLRYTLPRKAHGYGDIDVRFDSCTTLVLRGGEWDFIKRAMTSFTPEKMVDHHGENGDDHFGTNLAAKTKTHLDKPFPALPALSTSPLLRPTQSETQVSPNSTLYGISGGMKRLAQNKPRSLSELENLLGAMLDELITEQRNYDDALARRSDTAMPGDSTSTSVSTSASPSSLLKPASFVSSSLESQRRQGQGRSPSNSHGQGGGGGGGGDGSHICSRASSHARRIICHGFGGTLDNGRKAEMKADVDVNINIDIDTDRKPLLGRILSWRSTLSYNATRSKLQDRLSVQIPTQRTQVPSPRMPFQHELDENEGEDEGEEPITTPKSSSFTLRPSSLMPSSPSKSPLSPTVAVLAKGMIEANRRL